MLKRNVRDSIPAFVGVFVLVASIGTSTNPLARVWPQRPQKVITDEELGPDPGPITVSDVKLRENAVNLNKLFDGDDEWIRDISFKIKNRSTKNITYVGLNLVFSDTSSGDPGMVRQLRFGKRTEGSGSGPANQPLLLKPGDLLDVSIPAQYQSLKKFIEMKKQVKSINKVTISVYLVLFEDGMKWDVGNFYLPDASEPFGFRKIPAPVGILKHDQ